MWLLYLVLAIMTAASTIVLVRPPLDRKMAAVLTAILPALALLLYLMLGRPDLPAASHAAPYAATEALAPRHAMLLMRRPLEILKNRDAEDLGALSAMAELSLRLKQYGRAAYFYDHAAEAAARAGDPREDIFREKLKAAQDLAAQVR